MSIDKDEWLLNINISPIFNFSNKKKKSEEAIVGLEAKGHRAHYRDGVNYGKKKIAVIFGYAADSYRISLETNLMGSSVSKVKNGSLILQMLNMQ